MLNLSLFGESLTDGNGYFKSNKLIEKVLINDFKVKVNEVIIEGLRNISIKVLTDLESDLTFFKYKEDIVPFAGEIFIVDILSNKNNDLYIFSQSVHSDLSYYDVTFMDNKGLRILGSYEAPNIYGEANFQKLEEIHKGVDYIFKSRNNNKYLYSNLNRAFIKNKTNQREISYTKIKQYFYSFEENRILYAKKYLSEKEVQKIKKLNKSYQVYQELNKYDIFLMLIMSSKKLKVWKKGTDLKYFHLIEEDMKDGIISAMVYIDKEGRGFSSDEPASLGIIGQFNYNIKTKKLIETITDNKDLRQQMFDRVWEDIIDTYLFDKKREYLFIKKKTFLYRKSNLKNKSKKFLIKNDCALIIDKTDDGWYKVFYYHPQWKTYTIMWIKFDAEKHGLIR